MTASGHREDSATHGQRSRVGRRLIRGSAWVFGGRIAAAGFAIILYATLARTLGHGQLGVYFLVLNLVTIGSSIGEMGLDRTAVRYIASALAVGDAGRARRTVTNVLLLGMLGATACSAVVVIALASPLANYVFHSTLPGTLIVLIAAWLIASTLQGLQAEIMRGFQQFGYATLFNGLLVTAFSTVVFAGAWLVAYHPTVGWVVTVSLLVTCGCSIYAGFVVRRRTASLGPRGHAPAGELMGVSWPLLITTVAGYALGPGIDLWVVGAFGSQSNVAVYGATNRLALMLAMPFLMAAQVVPPIIAELDAGGKRRQLERSVRAVSTIATIPAIAVTVIYVFAGGDILGLLFGHYYASGATILVVLSCARVVLVATGSSAPALTMTGHQRALMNITVASAVLSVAGEIVLGWRFGMVGVALGTSIALTVQNFLQLFLAKRLLGVWTHAYIRDLPSRLLHLRRSRRRAAVQ